MNWQELQQVPTRNHFVLSNYDFEIHVWEQIKYPQTEWGWMMEAEKTNAASQAVFRIASRRLSVRSANEAKDAALWIVHQEIESISKSFLMMRGVASL